MHHPVKLGQYSSKYLNTFLWGQGLMIKISTERLTTHHNTQWNTNTNKAPKINTNTNLDLHPQAHNTPVYNIQWNTFIPNIFITCASGFLIKKLYKNTCASGGVLILLQQVVILFSNDDGKDDDDDKNKDFEGFDSH